MKHKTTKIVENIDDKVWNTFVAFCKMKGVLVGIELSSVLKDHLVKFKPAIDMVKKK